MPEAATNGPDLSTAVAKMESLMDDVCTITVDSDQAEDLVLDEATGGYVDSGHGAYLYQGPCMLRAEKAYDIAEHGGRTVAAHDFKLSLPNHAPEIPRGAIVKMTASRRDPRMVNQRFAVTDTTTSTFTIAQRLFLERLTEPRVESPLP